MASYYPENVMFAEVQRQAPRVDTTFLYKSNASSEIRDAGPLKLYKMALYLHLKKTALEVSQPDDELFVVIAEFGTKETAQAARAAVEDVCAQINRKITLRVWSARSSWGLQVADYALWTVQRNLEGKKCSWYVPCIEPNLTSTFFPRGKP